MTATIQYGTSLVERGRAERDRIQRQQQDAIEERQRKYAIEEREHLAREIKRWFGIDVDTATIAVIGGFASVEVEGLTFGFRKTNKDYPGDRPELVIAQPCDKGCGVDVWLIAHYPTDISDAVDSSQRHAWDCTDERSKRPAAPIIVPREERAIDDVLAAAEVYAQAVVRIMELEDGRASEKSMAIRRLMQTTNDETGKQHSASSAEKIVELDSEYAAYRKQQRDAEVDRWRADGALFAAKQHARLAVASVRAGDDD